MKTIIRSFIFIAAFTVGSISPLLSQSTQELYQKALVKEEGEGSLLEAIDIYNQIVENESADPVLQAKSLLHIGFCYEKLGREEATKAYQRLVNNFPGQRQEVAVARERLSRLIVQNKNTAGEKKGLQKTLTNRKIWDESGTDLEGFISPDGRYLSYIDWDTGDLALYEIATGKKRRLTDKGPWIKSAAYCEYSRWFPDSKKIVYLWINEDSSAEIRTINIDNPEPKLLIKDKALEWAEIYDCSSDGKYVLAWLDRRNDEGNFTLISSDDGSERVLGSNFTTNAAFSNDQRFVIYDLPQEGDTGNRDLYMMELDNMNETKLIDHPGDDRLMDRIPNGNDILFVSDRTGTPDFWSIKVQNGQRIGEAVLVKSNRGPFLPVSLGFSNNGTFYYGKQNNNINVYEVEIEPITGEILTSPKRMIKSYIGTNGCPEYSPDGKYLAYVSRRPPVTMRYTTNPAGNVLCIRSLDTNEEKEFRPDIYLFGWPKWSPDGKTVMVVRFDENGHIGYYQIDIHSGISKPFLMTKSRNLFGGHGWLPDGNTFFYGLRDSIAREFQLILQNIKSGEKQVLYKSRSQFGISASPDGSCLSILSGFNKSMKILPVQGGEPIELFNSDEVKDYDFEVRGAAMTWSIDGEYVYFSMKPSGDTSGWELCRVSIANHQIDKLGIKTNIQSQFANLNAHPDGMHFSYSLRDKINSEVWELDNFLPLDQIANNNETEAAKEPEEIKIKQIWKGPEVDISGTVSLNGEYLSFVDSETLGIAVRNLTTKKNTSLIEGSYHNPIRYAQYSCISPDGKQIAYNWVIGKTSGLYLIDLERPTPNLLYKQEGETVIPVTWLSEKELIVIVWGGGNEDQVCLFNILDRTMQVMKTSKPVITTGPLLRQLCSSPDGKYIAYGFYNETHNGNIDINIHPMDGKAEISLIKHPANDIGFGWVPGTKEFLFISDRSGTWDLWAIAIDNGKPSGPCKRIYADLGEVQPMGFTENGDCYFGLSRGNVNTYVAPFDAANGDINEKSGKIIMGSNLWMSYSPDGNFLSYIKTGKKSWQLTIQEVKTGIEHKLANNLEIAWSPCWSPNGNSILVVGLDKNKSQTEGYEGGIYTVDVKTGKTTEILLLSNYKYNNPTGDALPLTNIRWSSDGNSIFMLFFQDRLLKYNLETGKAETLYMQSHFDRGVLNLSPDGKRLLFSAKSPEQKKGHLYTMPVGGGKEKELCSPQESDNFRFAAWSPDGLFIYFMEEMEGTNLWRIPAEGGIPQLVWQSDDRIEGFDFHPDGKQISYAIHEQTTEIRVIEGILQELEKNLQHE